MNRFKDAIQVQDACNLCGVAQAFVKICKEVLHETSQTDAVRRDPAVILFMDKMWDMVHRPDFDDFHVAYNKCEELQDEKETETE